VGGAEALFVIRPSLMPVRSDPQRKLFAIQDIHRYTLVCASDVAAVLRALSRIVVLSGVHVKAWCCLTPPLGLWGRTREPGEYPGEVDMSSIPQVPATNAGSIKVLVVDDHGLVRDSVSSLLAREPDIVIVGVAEDADAAISKVLELKPDLVLMDIDMPGISCFDAIQIVRSRVPQTKFILVTAYEHDEHLEQALKVRANGFIVKSQGMSSLIGAIREVAAGRIHYSPEIMSRLIVEGDQIRLENPPKSRLSTLSPRERELLRVLARGQSLKEAASILGISYKTADKQKASLMAKLDIHDRVELARYAIREGLVEP